MESTDQLETLEQDGSVPETRMSSASSVIDRVKRLIDADSSRSYRRQLVKGLVDGNPPYSQTDLENSGRAYQCNVNWRIAESYLNQTRSAFYDIVSESPTLATVTCTHGTPDQQANYTGVITEEFDRLLRKDDTADYHVQISQYEMVLYGSGPLVFPDRYDWHHESALHRDLLVPDMSRSDPTLWDECAILRDYLPHELYDSIRNESQATKLGWDVEAVKQAIIRAHPKSSSNEHTKTWEWHQQKLKNNSFSYDAESKVIPCAHYLFREFPQSGESKGRITHTIVPITSTTESQKKGDTAFLFRRERCYESWLEFVHPMYCDNDGGGYHHSVTGLGVKMFSAMAYQNRLLCNIADKAFAPKVIFRPTTASDNEEWNVIQWGDYARIPANFEPVQTPVQSYLDDVLAVNREFTGLISSNLSQYKSAVSKESGNPITATEMQFRASEQARLGKTQLNHYYNQLDRFFAEKYRRVVACPAGMKGGLEAEEFRKKCKERGVPIEALKTARARATRIIGQGSQYMRQQALQALLASVALWPSERGRENLIRDFIAAYAGQTMVERYAPPNGPESQTEDNVTAMLQVAGSKAGVTPVVTPEQNSAVYAPVFIAAAGNAIKSVEQGGNPTEVIPFIQTLAPAVGQHLAKLASDPTRKTMAKGLDDQWQAVMEEAGKLDQQVQQMLQKQAQQQQEAQQNMQRAQSIAAGFDPKTQVQAAATQAKIRQQQQKTDAGLAMKAQKHAQDMALADATTAAEIHRQNMRERNKPESNE